VKDIWHFIMPEWRKLDHLEKERAFKASTRAIGWRRWSPMLVLPYMATIWWVDPLYKMGLIFAGFVLPPLLTLLVYRAALQNACWAILATRGEPICTACGYNLTGNVSGVCPECGRACGKVTT